MLVSLSAAVGSGTVTVALCSPWDAPAIWECSLLARGPLTTQKFLIHKLMMAPPGSKAWLSLLEVRSPIFFCRNNGTGDDGSHQLTCS